MLEWDAKIPPFPEVHAEVMKARQYIDDAHPGLPLAQPASGPEETDGGGIPQPLHLIPAEVE